VGAHASGGHPISLCSCEGEGRSCWPTPAGIIRGLPLPFLPSFPWVNSLSLSRPPSLPLLAHGHGRNRNDLSFLRGLSERMGCVRPPPPGGGPPWPPSPSPSFRLASLASSVPHRLLIVHFSPWTHVCMHARAHARTHGRGQHDDRPTDRPTARPPSLLDGATSELRGLDSPLSRPPPPPPRRPSSSASARVRAGQGRAGQGRAGQGRAGQGKGMGRCLPPWAGRRSGGRARVHPSHPSGRRVPFVRRRFRLRVSLPPPPPPLLRLSGVGSKRVLQEAKGGGA